MLRYSGIAIDTIMLYMHASRSRNEMSHALTHTPVEPTLYMFRKTDTTATSVRLRRSTTTMRRRHLATRVVRQVYITRARQRIPSLCRPLIRKKFKKKKILSVSVNKTSDIDNESSSVEPTPTQAQCIIYYIIIYFSVQ